MRTTHMLGLAAGAVSALLLVAAWRGSAQGGDSIIPVATTSTILGQSLPGLSDILKQNFQFGLQKFSTTETPDDGLGPVFNGTSCAECHLKGAIGGAGFDLVQSRETRIGALVNGVYSDLPELGGPVIQRRSLHEFDLNNPVLPEVVPPAADFVSRRITTPLFGLGLLEAIPDSTILANVRVNDPDGITGEANRVTNPESGNTEIGRFGWKAQVSRMHVFSGDAYLNEMGVTSPTFPNESLPQGKPIPPGANPDPNSPNDDGGDVQAFTDFMRFLAPPAPRLPITPQIQAGASVFVNLRCSVCHVPLMRTASTVFVTVGPFPPGTTVEVPALENKEVRAFTDLLLHDMGPGLADGIRQPSTAPARRGSQFRTAPLWGLGRRRLFLHDGRAATIEDAIEAHGGEALASRNRFEALQINNPAAVANLLAFLRDL